VAETVGWLADKLSIVELKIYHMQEQADRTDAAPEFRERCEGRLEVLRLQRDDLAAELTQLLSDVGGKLEGIPLVAALSICLTSILPFLLWRVERAVQRRVTHGLQELFL